MTNHLRSSPFYRTLALVPLLMVLAVQLAKGDVFAKIENSSGGIEIPGESTSNPRVGWIDVQSVQFGVTNPTTLSTGTITGSKSVGSDIVFTKSLDKSSPLLFLSCAQGTRQPKVILEFINPSSTNTQLKAFYRITLTGVVISSFSSSANASDSRPSESVSLSYEKITTEYFMQDDKGTFPTTPTATSTWSFATGSPK